MNLAIIPARGSSKRIPRKNIKTFCGKPMIVWTIEAALNAACFDHIIVSTDDNEIAEIALRHGAEVPFMRPDELSDDLTPTRPVVNHAIGMASDLWETPEYVCCLYATAPFLQSGHISNALQRLKDSHANFVFSASVFAYPIKRAFRLNEAGRAERLWPEHRYTRSQDLEESYHDAGQFYWGRSQAFLDNLDPISDNGVPEVLHRKLVHDIDTLEDWETAELIFRALTQTYKDS